MTVDLNRIWVSSLYSTCSSEEKMVFKFSLRIAVLFVILCFCYVTWTLRNGTGQGGPDVKVVTHLPREFILPTKDCVTTDHVENGEYRPAWSLVSTFQMLHQL